MYVGCQASVIRHKLARERREKIEQSPEIGEVMPFCLDVTPTEPWRIPAKGFLEVKISNNTCNPYTLDITFDSFFFDLNHNFHLKKRCRGYSVSATSGYDHLDPQKSITLKIGFSDKIPSKDRINYKHPRPEGFLRIVHFENDKWPVREPIVPPGRISETRIFELEVKKESEKYEELREQFAKIKKDQERRVRWGQELEIRDGLVFKICKNEKGEVVESDICSTEDQLKTWQVLNIPDDLEKIDGMTDEEMKKWRMERWEKIEIAFDKLDVFQKQRKATLTDILKDMERKLAEQEVKKMEKSKIEKPVPPKK